MGNTEQNKLVASRSVRSLLVLIGFGIALIPLANGWLTIAKPTMGLKTILCLTVSACYILFGLFFSIGSTKTKRAAIALIVIPLSLTSIELVGRLSGIDFSDSDTKLANTPIYYRQPTVPVGEVFFRRPGPSRWTGRVLTTELRHKNILELDAYSDEKQITASYDRNGFRNRADLESWEIVIIGDAFVELGFLNDEDLFTAQMGKRLDCEVKNLGLSYSGPFSHICFLKQFGISEKTEDAVIIFFEGNDWQDARREFDWLEQFKETGSRPTRSQTKPQSSFARAAFDLLMSQITSSPPIKSANAAVQLKSKSVSVTLNYAPPNRSELDPKTVQAVESAFEEFARFTQQQNIRPWVVYMPCKRRSFHKHLIFNANCPDSIQSWVPSDLPDWIKGLSQKHEIHFVNLTPQFVKQTNDGVLLYNPIYDTHVNLAGSTEVSKILSDAILNSRAKLKKP